MTRYEYLTRRMDTTSLTMIQDDLNNIGRQGWELVEVLPERTYIFRRPVAEQIGPSETKIVEPAEKKAAHLLALPFEEAIARLRKESRD